ncbi:MAG: exosortase-associated EpsI family protein [Phycisphaerae bacterium]
MADRPTTNGSTIEARPDPTDAAEPALWPARARATACRKTTPRFYVCVGILLLAAVSMQSLVRWFEVTFRKQPIPLKRSLDALDRDKLLPEYEPHRIQPRQLSSEVLKNLGTEEYLQWSLRDRDRDRNDPTAVVRLFITYHTGQPDMVPHNPTECLHAAGMTLRKETRIEVAVPAPDGALVRIPVSVLEFELPRRMGVLLRGRAADPPRLVVAYFFYANGRYVTSRIGVRTAVANLWDRHAYYSKIELSFTDDAFRRLPNREQAEKATRRLLRKLMPILWEDHYQDWEALKNGTPPVILEP